MHIINSEYLDKFGKFVLELIDDLGLKKDKYALRLRTGVDFNSYRYMGVALIWLIDDPGIDDNLVLQQSIGLGTTFVSTLRIQYVQRLKEYQSCTDEDFFSLSTVLSDSELVELYVTRDIQMHLKNKRLWFSRIVLNVPLMQRYYNNYGLN